MEQMKITIADSWNDITLEQFDQLRAIDTTKDNEEQVIDMVAICSNLTREQVMQMRYSDFVTVSAKLQFLNTQPVTHVPDTELEVDGKKFRVTTALHTITAAQFIDYKQIAQDTDDNMRLARICSCFVIPAGCEYATGYDTDAHVEFLYKHLSVVEAHSLSAFFTLQSKAYTIVSLRSLRRRLKRIKTTTAEQKVKKAEILAQMDKVRDALSAVNGGR